MKVFMTLLGTLVGASAIMAGSPHGYYKTRGVRVPPHPPLPPAKLHYGPKPPSAYPYKRAVYTSHHIPYHHPGHYHSPQSKVLIPLRGSHQTYQYSRHRPSFPPKPTPPPPPQPPAIPSYAWNSHIYNAPAPIEQSFLGQSYGVPSSSYGVSLYNDDRGPIHTIPAPNLGPADKPSNGEGGGYTYSSAQADLAAVLNHANFVNAQKHSYQVTEDPSLHQPHSVAQSYFAPDPDPSIAIPKVPTTLDPHSLPSNGQVPLDLYLQQQSEQHQEGNNALTAQDLFNLLNGYSQQQQQLGLLQQGQGQYLQPGQAFYNPAVLLPQQLPVPVQQEFHPQFQTFNYEEQTQQGAHGTDSFPSASNVDMDMERPEIVARNTDEKSQMTAQDLNGIAGNEKNDIYDKVAAIKGSSESVPNQEEFEEDKNEIDEGANDNSFYTTLPNREAAETLATLAAAGSLNSQMKENGQEQQRDVESDEYEEEDGKEETNRVSQSVTKSVSTSQQQQNVDENVQVQKAIRIYETHIGTGSPEPKTPMTRDEEEEVMEYDDREYSLQERGEVPQHADQSSSVQVEKAAGHESQEEVDDVQSQLPFGARLRPKRT